MSDNPYYYNGDDWRLFDPNKYNTVNLDIKNNQPSNGKEFDQVKYLVDKIKNRPF